MPTIEGTVAPGFERCRDAFTSGFSTGVELGAACSIFVDGEAVVDLWGGIGDPDTGREWERDTIVPVFSVSKGVAAVCVLQQVARGLIELDAPVARYWPEFGQAGKEEVTVREALAHRAGVPFIDGEIHMDDLRSVENMAARLANQPPLFEPGSAHLYHPITIGWITSELVRRVTGSTVGRWLSSEIAEPLDLSLFFGVPDLKRDRVARLSYREPEKAKITVETTMVPDSMPWKALTLNGVLNFEPELGDGSLNDPRVQALELPGAGLVANAYSLARFYAACIAPVGGVRLLSDELIRDAIRPVSTGKQLGMDTEGPAWGAGVMIPWSVQPMLGGSSFGHDGMGGSLAFACPDRKVSFAYVRNRVAAGGFKDPEAYAVVEALGEVLNHGRAA